MRGAAAFPGVLPEALPDSLVQTVHIDDLAFAVVTAACAEIPSGTIAEITEATAHTLPELMGEIRAWQGFGKPLLRVPVPAALLMLTGAIVAGLGHVGSRSPLRSTALTVLLAGVRGDPGPWSATGGPMPRGLGETLAALPAARQERLFARLYFVLPLAIAVQSIFWLTSGLVALLSPAVAASTLAGSALPAWVVNTRVVGGALVDVALGATVL